MTRREKEEQVARARQIGAAYAASGVRLIVRSAVDTSEIPARTAWVFYTSWSNGAQLPFMGEEASEEEALRQAVAVSDALQGRI